MLLQSASQRALHQQTQKTKPLCLCISVIGAQAQDGAADNRMWCRENIGSHVHLLSDVTSVFPLAFALYITLLKAVIIITQSLVLADIHYITTNRTARPCVLSCQPAIASGLDSDFQVGGVDFLALRINQYWEKYLNNWVNIMLVWNHVFNLL